MARTYTELFYHFVWSTKNREPLITPELELLLYGQIHAKCKELGVIVHALNGMPDHVHLCCTMPVGLCISDLMEKVKGSSSHFINQRTNLGIKLYWQPGYGALTVSKRHLATVVNYIDNQKQHHSENTLSGKLERTSEDSTL
jgi:putative transposase